MISEEQRDVLNRHLSLNEVIIVIDKLKLNKAPGPDGLTSEFYKVFQLILPLILLKVYCFALEGKLIPSTWHEAVMVLPKKRKDLSRPHSDPSHF